MAYNFQALAADGTVVDLQLNAAGNLFTTGDATLRSGANVAGQGYLMLALDPDGNPTPLSVDVNGNLKVVKN